MTSQQKAAYFLSKALRFSIFGLALWQFWPKLTGKEPFWQSVDLTPPDQLFGRSEPIVADLAKRRRIEEAFEWSWGAYEDNAFGADEYNALSQSGHNLSSAGGVGYFIIDSLDSLLLFDMKDEYKRARDWVAGLSFDVDDRQHTFEITIRVLGGLLAAYHHSGNDKMYLEKAVDLADRLLPAFDTASGLPLSFVNFAQRVGIPDADNRGWTSVAEAATLQLELKYLSELTGNPVYWQKAEKAMEIIRQQPKKDGLVPIFMSPETGGFLFSEIRLGSRGDSYYEYLLKQYLQTAKTEPIYREMHDEAMAGIKQHLLQTTPTGGYLYTTELAPRRDQSGQIVFQSHPKQDHLVAFLGASLLMGVTEGTGPVPPDPSTFSPAQSDDFFAGQQLIRTFVATYTDSKTGLGAEIVNYYRTAEDAIKNRREWFINSRRKAGPPPIDARNILRPETVESLMFAYRITGDPVYREWGWQIFEAFEKHCRLPGGGYAGIKDVDELPVTHEDRMETFWIAETLKYLYLLFSDATVYPLDKLVANTEAHFLPVFVPTVVV